MTEVELVYKNKIPAKDRLKVASSQAAHDVFRLAWDENLIDLVEEFKIILLAANNTVIGLSHVAKGSTTQCLADPKIVFAICLKSNASAICLAHNHPSGNPCPSETDLQLTAKFCEAARLLDIKVLDHLILTRHGYTSLEDDGLMPSFN
ncbi:JAB domain-containing protein [Mucilaginibacter pedocola]|uniref:JAB domain-containing protein n=1 Tax=Mucilaginibacter pedocola TaxID=1792845 RepID=UPI00192E49FA|nr:JAB domain-containing protein [Mucilaginibacter pedocola]